MFLIQSPSYFCFLQLLENWRIEGDRNPFVNKPVSILMILKKAMTRFDIKAAILAPNFNNPDGSFH